jgi:hypothetical protein
MPTSVSERATTQRENTSTVPQAGCFTAHRTKILAIPPRMPRRAAPPAMSGLADQAQHEEPHSFPPGQIVTRCGRKLGVFHPLGRIHH